MNLSHRIAIVFSLLLVASVHAADVSYLVESVDSAQNSVTLKSKTLQLTTLHVLPGADISIDGNPAQLSDLKQAMPVQVRLSGPGEAQSLFAQSQAPKKAPAPTPFAGFDSMSTDPFTSDQSGQIVKATITAKSPNAFELNNIKKGTRITFHYMDGKWKSMGFIPTDNPDAANTVDHSRLVLALPSTGKSPGEAVAIVPAGTKNRGFVYIAQQDYPKLVLRVNGSKFNGPGSVRYDLHIEPPRE